MSFRRCQWDESVSHESLSARSLANEESHVASARMQRLLSFLMMLSSIILSAGGRVVVLFSTATLTVLFRRGRRTPFQRREAVQRNVERRQLLDVDVVVLLLEKEEAPCCHRPVELGPSAVPARVGCQLGHHRLLPEGAPDLRGRADAGPARHLCERGGR